MLQTAGLRKPKNDAAAPTGGGSKAAERIGRPRRPPPPKRVATVAEARPLIGSRKPRPPLAAKANGGEAAKPAAPAMSSAAAERIAQAKARAAAKKAEG
ncbi:MAG: hypothetical protein R2932_22095 [Caldilineaceae bacterium]